MDSGSIKFLPPRYIDWFSKVMYIGVHLPVVCLQAQNRKLNAAVFDWEIDHTSSRYLIDPSLLWQF
jgi:hypothetical protein